METAQRERFRGYGGATPMFSLQGVYTWARVVDVYDGDTVTCVLPVLDRFYRFSVRVAGIDTCEMRSKNQANKEKAVQARDRLLQLVMGASTRPRVSTKKDIEALLEAEVYVVWMKCLEFDKYGRLLASLSASETAGETFAEVLVREGLAYPYSGETKLTEEQQLLVLGSTRPMP